MEITDIEIKFNNKNKSVFLIAVKGKKTVRSIRLTKGYLKALGFKLLSK